MICFVLEQVTRNIAQRVTFKCVESSEYRDAEHKSLN
jgi:hypothetical protein